MARPLTALPLTATGGNGPDALLIVLVVGPQNAEFLFLVLRTTHLMFNVWSRDQTPETFHTHTTRFLKVASKRAEQ